MFLMKMRWQLLLTKFLTYAYFFFYYMVTSSTSISPDKNSQKLLLR